MRALRLFVFCAVSLGVLTAVKGADPIEVIGKSAGQHHHWVWSGEESPDAPVGKPDGRLQIKVKNGDIVRFVVESGSHGVLFEKAKTEVDAGVWEVVQDTGELKELPPAPGFDRFDRVVARTTARLGSGETLIDIKIKDLKAGPENGILIGCNPHSTLGTEDKAMMVAVLVLAGDEEESPETKNSNAK
jgi:hypothetical protein